MPMNYKNIFKFLKIKPFVFKIKNHYVICYNKKKLKTAFTYSKRYLKVLDHI